MTYAKVHIEGHILMKLSGKVGSSETLLVHFRN